MLNHKTTRRVNHGFGDGLGMSSPGNPIPAMAAWEFLGDHTGMTPQTGLPATATGWGALSPATHDLTVLSGWEPTITATNKPPRGADWIADCEPDQKGFTYPLTSGERDAIKLWTTSSGFIVFRFAAVGAAEQLFMGFANDFGGRYYGLGVDATEFPMLHLFDNTDFVKHHKAVALTVGFHTLSFTKGNAVIPRLWLDGAELTSLTGTNNTHGLTDWFEVLAANEIPLDFGIGGRITDETVNEFTVPANIQVELFGWCEEALSETKQLAIHSYAARTYGV